MRPTRGKFFVSGDANREAQLAMKNEKQRMKNAKGSRESTSGAA
jgi:hypothetical protein